MFQYFPKRANCSSWKYFPSIASISIQYTQSIVLWTLYCLPCLTSIFFLARTDAKKYFFRILFPTIVVYMMNIHHDVDGDEKMYFTERKINCDSLSDKGRFSCSLPSRLRRNDDDSKNRFFICDCHKKESGRVMMMKNQSYFENSS